MRLLLSILSLIALALAPVPSVAMAAPMNDHCAEMKGGMAPHHGKAQLLNDGKCCLAVPAALAPASGDVFSRVVVAAVPAARPVPQLTAIHIDEDDPPPRS